MGEVIRFPDELGPRGGKYVDANTEPATVIILPVIRIDRGPGGRARQGQRRRTRPSSKGRTLSEHQSITPMKILSQPPKLMVAWRRHLLVFASRASTCVAAAPAPPASCTLKPQRYFVPRASSPA